MEAAKTQNWAVEPKGKKKDIIVIAETRQITLKCHQE
jgi:hypothetical protein